MAKIQTIYDQRAYDFRQAAGEAISLAEALRYSIWAAIAFPDPIVRWQDKELGKHINDTDEQWREFVERVNPGYINGPSAIEIPALYAMTGAVGERPSPLDALAEHLRTIDGGAVLDYPELQPVADALAALSDLILPYLGLSSSGDAIRAVFNTFLPALDVAIERITFASPYVAVRRPSPFRAASPKIGHENGHGKKISRPTEATQKWLVFLNRKLQHSGPEHGRLTEIAEEYRSENPDLDISIESLTKQAYRHPTWWKSDT